jgi:hypothetical protein
LTRGQGRARAGVNSIAGRQAAKRGHTRPEYAQAPVSGRVGLRMRVNSWGAGLGLLLWLSADVAAAATDCSPAAPMHPDLRARVAALVGPNANAIEGLYAMQERGVTGLALLHELNSSPNPARTAVMNLVVRSAAHGVACLHEHVEVKTIDASGNPMAVNLLKRLIRAALDEKHACVFVEQVADTMTHLIESRVARSWRDALDAAMREHGVTMPVLMFGCGA